jgi:hypothetical protein
MSVKIKRYEKITPENFLFQKFNLKLAHSSLSLSNVRRVLSDPGLRQYYKRTEIYENLSRTLCVYSPSRELERQNTDGTYLL